MRDKHPGSAFEMEETDLGQKVHPYGLRLGIIKGWKSKWFDKRNYTENLHEDLNLRKYIKERLYNAGIADILIERPGNKLRITIIAAKPGMIIGRGGKGVDDLRLALEKQIGKPVSLNIEEIKKADLDAQLVAESIAAQLEKRTSFRRAMKQAVSRAMKMGAKGVKVGCSGRLGGAEMSRSESYKEGKIPLHTLRADIDYGNTEAVTTYGQIGVKVWIYKGEVLPELKKPAGQVVSEQVPAAVSTGKE